MPRHTLPHQIIPIPQRKGAGGGDGTVPTSQMRSLSLEWLKVETSLVLSFAMKYLCPEYESWLCHLPGGKAQDHLSSLRLSILIHKAAYGNILVKG